MNATILVVDDSRVERQLVEGLLTRNAFYDVELAENGRDALERIAASAPDLILTDLLMPEMNGLELVRYVRQKHPTIPIIVMTAYGDEDTAFESLEAGAASYVPKSRQAEQLVQTVDRVIEHAAVDRTRERISECMLEYACRFALNNDLRLIRTFVDHVQQVMANQRFGDTVERIRIGEALEEALLNAMYHGNLEVDERELARVRAELDDRALRQLIAERSRIPRIRDRCIVVVIEVTATRVRFVIRDQGRGFNSRFAETETPGSRFERGRHRGLTLMQSLMDEVSYNSHGNELTMRRQLRQPALAGNG